MAMAVSTSVAATSVLAFEHGSTGYYGDIGYHMMSYDSDSIGTFDNSVLVGKLGYKMTPYIGIEGVLGSGISDDSNNILGTKYTSEITSFYGAYFTGFVPLGERFGLNAKVGYADTSIKIKTANRSKTDSDGSFSWGVGASYSIANNIKVGLDYTSLYDNDGDITGLGATITYSF